MMTLIRYRSSLVSVCVARTALTIVQACIVLLPMSRHLHNDSAKIKRRAYAAVGIGYAGPIAVDYCRCTSDFQSLSV